MNHTYLKYALILGILTAFGPICTDFYLPALPEIATHLNTTSTLSQLTLTASLLGLGLGQLFFGPWSDRVGRKTPLLIALGLFTLSSIACAMVQHIEQMIVIRFIQGFAGAGGAVLARAIANDRYTGNDLARFLALIMAINGIAPVLAPVLGGIQLTLTSWRGLFITLAGLGGLVLVLCLIALKESHQVETLKSSSISVFSSFKTIIKDRIFLGLCFTQSLVMGGLFAYIGASSYVFQEIYSFSPQQYSLLFAVNGCGLIAAAIITSKLIQRYSLTQLLTKSLIFSVVISILLFLFSLLHAPLYLTLIALFLSLAVVSSISTLANTLAMQRQTQYSGTTSALLGFSMFAIGGVTAPLSTVFDTSLFSMSSVIVGCYVLAFMSYHFLCNRLSK